MVLLRLINAISMVYMCLCVSMGMIEVNNTSFPNECALYMENTKAMPSNSSEENISPTFLVYLKYEMYNVLTVCRSLRTRVQ